MTLEEIKKEAEQLTEFACNSDNYFDDICPLIESALIRVHNEALDNANIQIGDNDPWINEIITSLKLPIPTSEQDK